MKEKFETQLTKIYPNGLTGKEIIHRITEIYHAGYDLGNPSFDIYEQLLVCESLAETEAEEQKKYRGTNENVSVSGSVNDTYKRRVNLELTESKLKVIQKLKGCIYQTPPVEIAQCLEELFREYESKEGHWLYIAQTYPPRAINWNLSYMIKVHSSGRRTFQNWAAYFTESIKFRKKRKEFRNTNDTHKHNRREQL